MTTQLTLVIGNKNYSSWSLRPWLFLKYMEVSFHEVRIPLYTETSEMQIKAYSPSAKVPVLHDGDLMVWDSIAICEYVNDKYLAGQGLPQDISTRAIARSISAEMHSGFMAMRKELPMNCRRKIPNLSFSAEAQQDISRICEIWRTCRTQYGQHGPWLFGPFSIADAMFAPVAFRLNIYGIALGNMEQAYVDALLGLPALQAWQQAAQQETEVISDFERS